MYPRAVLNKEKWGGNLTLKGIEIIYLNRGSPDDRASFKGSDIQELGKSFVIFQRKGDKMETAIPYHRIRLIKRNEEVIWEDKTGSSESEP